MILAFQPNCHKAIWGEENWLVSALPSSPSIPVPVPGSPEYMPGTFVDFAPSFPLLVKTIDAHQRLSVQVHPNDQTYRVTGGLPKTEMWCALSDGYVYAGLKRGVTPVDVGRAVVDGSFESLLVRHDLKAGDALFIPGGMVHSIGDSTFVYEVQQSSDTTFRLYDWGRLGPDGLPRTLHIDKALNAIDYTLEPPKVVRDVSCRYFDFNRIDVKGEIALAPSPFIVLYVFSGAVRLATETLKRGDSRLVFGEDAPLLLSSDSAQVLVTRAR